MSKLLLREYYELCEGGVCQDFLTEAEKKMIKSSARKFKIKNFDKKIYSNLIDNGYICDYRSPDILRIAPAPLYNSFEDVYNFSNFLNSSIND